MKMPTPVYEVKPLFLLFTGLICMFTLHPIGQFGGGLLIIAALLIFNMRKPKTKWIKGKYAEVRILDDDGRKRTNH